MTIPHPFGLSMAITALFMLSDAYAEERRVLKVGPSHDVRSPSDAAAIANDGDIVEIEAGVYSGDVAVWRADDLTIRSIGGKVVLDAAGRSAEDKAIWVISGSDIEVDGIEFKNASVPDHNGAGIRFQGQNLHVRNAVFSYNETGILTVDDPNSQITIENSIFIGNGFGDGYSHGAYIGDIGKLEFFGNYVYGTVIGHHLKSKAEINHISHNLFVDGKNGSSSYSIDLPYAQKALITGNIFHQGINTENYTIINFQSESHLSEVNIYNNTFVTEIDSGKLARLDGDLSVDFRNNVIAGSFELGGFEMEKSGNFKLSRQEFVNAEAYDFRLANGSKAIDAGLEQDRLGNTIPKPAFEYRHPARAVPRPLSGPIDSGALEFQAE